MNNHRQRGQTLAASLVVIAIIAICAVILIKGTPDTAPKAKADGRGKTVLGNARASAQDEVCKSNLSQARQLLQVAKATDEETVFTKVSDIPGSGSVSKCYVGKEDYTYDAATGEIKCPHLGHEKY
jgi:type II secretory pathway pseudopilin PulG